MKKILMAMTACAALASFAADSTDLRIAARQRSPFSPVVDIDILMNGSTCADFSLQASYDGAAGPLDLLAGLVEGSPTLVPGRNHLVWDPVAAGLGQSRLEGFSVSATRVDSDSRKFLVIDLKNRTWTYYADDPDGAGWSDSKYRLRYIVFRRVPAGTYQLGYSPEQLARWASLGSLSDSNPNSAMRTVTITRDYYVSIYMLTAGQNTGIGWHSTKGNGGADGYYYGEKWVTSESTVKASPASWRGDFSTRTAGFTWPQNGHAVSMPEDGTEGSIVGRFRQLMKNGSHDLPLNMVIDLPTEAQWEVAARAGTTTFYDSCGTLTDDAATISEYQYAHATNKDVNVGLMLPNSWGLYDTMGLSYEMTLNTVPMSSSTPVLTDAVKCWVEGQNVDPVGYAVEDGQVTYGVVCNCGFSCRGFTWRSLPSSRRALLSSDTTGQTKTSARLAIHLAPLAR